MIFPAKTATKKHVSHGGTKDNGEVPIQDAIKQRRSTEWVESPKGKVHSMGRWS